MSARAKELRGSGQVPQLPAIPTLVSHPSRRAVRASAAVLGVLIVLAVVAAGCSSDDAGLDLESRSRPTKPSEKPVGTSDESSELLTGTMVDLSLTRDDVDCSRFGLGEEESVTFVAAHVVVDGVLGEPCLGDVDPTLLDSWSILVSMTPPAQLSDLALFGGFEATAGADSETLLAFVTALDDDGSQFQMSVNLQAAQVDAEELTLTIAHEFSHVFTGVSSELDRSPEAAENCTTYFNGEGCYRQGSLMAAWIEEFWADEIDEFDPDDEPTVASGEGRCAADPGYFGPYAASNPEEDFAESFSAYVLRLEASDDQQRRLDFLDEQPGLVEFRRRALASALGPLDNQFATCGLGT